MQFEVIVFVLKQKFGFVWRLVNEVVIFTLEHFNKVTYITRKSNRGFFEVYCFNTVIANEHHQFHREEINELRLTAFNSELFN